MVCMPVPRAWDTCSSPVANQFLCLHCPLLEYAECGSGRVFFTPSVLPEINQGYLQLSQRVGHEA
jgi:hypothetical protein